MAKTASKIVAQSQALNKEKGGGRLTMNLAPEENELWLALVRRFPAGRGQQKAAFMAAVRGLLASDNGGDEISRERLIEEITRRLR